MAHNNFNQLQMLIDIIDDERNAIFLHIDKKVWENYNLNHRVSSYKSEIIYVESLDVRWADVSQTDAEIEMFKEVIKTNIHFDRVHLISGNDLPIRSQDYIHDFFEKYPQLEFLTISKDSKLYKKRLQYYHFFVKSIRTNKMANIARRALLLIQLPFINRLKKSPFGFYCGHNWCSITLRAVKKIVETYEQCREIFCHTTSSDECYKQMILKSDKSFEFYSGGNLRYVKWGEQRSPSPEIITMDDFEIVNNSNCLFARKFDVRVDCEIVEKITMTVSKN